MAGGIKDGGCSPRIGQESGGPAEAEEEKRMAGGIQDVLWTIFCRSCPLCF